MIRFALKFRVGVNEHGERGEIVVGREPLNALRVARRRFALYGSHSACASVRAVSARFGSGLRRACLPAFPAS
jgi:hypothetical protein